MRAGDLMTTDVLTLDHDATVGEAVSLITEHEVRHVPILDGARPVAVLSDRDLRRVEGLVALDVSAPERVERVYQAPVTTLVGGPPVTCGVEASVDEVIDRLVAERVGALLVVDDDGRLAGIISTIDVLRAARGKL